MVTLIPSAAKAGTATTAILLLITGWVGLPLDIAPGFISDLIGRRRLFIYSSIIFAILSIPILYAFGVLGFIRGILGYAYLMTGIMMFSNTLIWGAMLAYLSERFPTSKRTSGVGFGYSLGLVIPAFTSIYVYYLHKAFTN